VNQGTRYEQALREQERDERNKRILARRFPETPETPSCFSILDAIKADPNVDPAFGRCIVGRPSLAERLAAKSEEYDADARGHDLWLARGGRDE
jgi:hypothetical protein